MMQLVRGCTWDVRSLSVMTTVLYGAQAHTSPTRTRNVTYSFPTSSSVLREKTFSGNQELEMVAKCLWPWQVLSTI